MTFRLVEYDNTYKELSKNQQEKLVNIIDGDCVIEHIGSTSIPGTAGKGVIDIMISFKTASEISRAVRLLEDSGYYFPSIRPEHETRVFMSSAGQRESGPGDIHLHLVLQNSPDHERAILFRDYLIKYPDTRQAYVDLKYKLYKQTSGNRPEYTRLKGQFINEVILLALNCNSSSITL